VPTSNAEPNLAAAKLAHARGNENQEAALPAAATSSNGASTVLKQWRGIAMRTDKLARDYRAAICVSPTLIWIKTDSINTA
jgi:hypothetical protein